MRGTDNSCHPYTKNVNRAPPDRSRFLTAAGVEFLHLGCNQVSTPPDVPILFWWEGPDGSRLMTLYWGGYYGTDLIPPEGWPFTSWLAIIHTNDNLGAPSLQEIKETLRKAHELAPNARIRVGRMSAFYTALLKEKPELPVVRGDMPDTWIHGPLCDPAGARTARNVRPAIAACESLHTMLRCWGAEAADVARRFVSKFPEAIELIMQKKVPVALLISRNTHSLEALATSVEEMSAHPEQFVKIIATF